MKGNDKMMKRQRKYPSGEEDLVKKTTPFKKEAQFWFGFDLHSSQSPLVHPERLELWDIHRFRRKGKANPALYYKADALVGLSLLLLHQDFDEPFQSSKSSLALMGELWKQLDPHLYLFEKSWSEMKNLCWLAHQSQSANDGEFLPIQSTFEKNFHEVLQGGFDSRGVDLSFLGRRLIPLIDRLEESLKTPLVFHLGLHFSKDFRKELQQLYAFLFHLRGLLGFHYNSKLKDSTFEALRLDSITDYLPKAEYILNDALLFWSLKKFREQIPENVYSHLVQSHREFSHNGFYLVEQLPEAYRVKIFEDLGSHEALYELQMNWLLGTDAGLLYRLREELYGLREGYHRTFWPEVQQQQEGGGLRAQASYLSWDCQISLRRRGGGGGQSVALDPRSHRNDRNDEEAA